MHNVLILGSGGREHAFAWKINQSALCNKLFIAPGNAGTEACGTNLALDLSNFQAIKTAVLAHDISLVLVGPEEPLVNGLHDFFLQDTDLKKVRFVGPCQQAAQLEGSKDFAKQFMQRHDIPTAAYQSFTEATLAEGLAYLNTRRLPIVLKADGLASGKGVLICHSLRQAKEALTAVLQGKQFGKAGNLVVIEDFLEGIELSAFIVTDGKDYKFLPSAKDYKHIGQGNTGLNTGGMGAVCPVPFADDALMKKVEAQIVKPTLSGLRKENIPYLGFLFIGLMQVKGQPFVIEYNVRLGDPETQSVLPRITSDFLSLLLAVSNKELGSYELNLDPACAVTIVLASGGYPESYQTGKPILGIKKTENCLVFHAGTKVQKDQLISAGGRVLAITALHKDRFTALTIARQNAELITFKGKYFRSDIGFDL